MAATQKIEYRIVTPEEKLHVIRLQNMVFSLKLDEKAVREKLEKGENKNDVTYGAIGEDGHLLAGMDVIPYSMWFDGQKTAMSGIGGVASVPESRRQGNIRGVFGAAFRDMYEKGTVFSHLYPFSHDYYRKFGYEQCGAAKKYSLPTGPARRLKNNGTAHEYIKGYDVRGELIKVYETYASRHNAMVSRSEKRWDDVFNISLFSNDRLYYWKDAGSNIKSWVKFARNNEKLQISDIVWSNHESMLGILQFMGMFEGSAKELVFTSSPEFIAELYWNNLYDIGIESAWLGMNRVINAKLALELLKKPGGEGKFVIRITDCFAEWNNKTFSVEYSGGESFVRETEQGADIEVSERALMQMVLGTYELEQIACRDDVRINGNMSMLKEVFFKKNILITDYF